MDDLVSPNTDATQEAPETPTPDPQESQAAELPPEILKQPTFQALIAGAPPALSVRLKGRDKSDFKLIEDNQDILQQAGFGFYKSLAGDRGVIFNSLYIHPQDIIAADKMGKLEQIAPPADAIHHAISKSGLANPVFKANIPQAPALPRSTTPPQTASGLLPVPSQQQAPASAGVQNRAQSARLAALKPSGPLTGAKPGAGRLLNQILKPVI